MPSAVFERIESLLNEHGIDFKALRHEPVFTSEEAAQIRGTPLASGAKALVCKGDEEFIMFVLPADRKLDSRAVRREKGWRKLRFASREEVTTLTGLAPGAIPPFGSLFDLPTLCDRRLGENELINFDAGDHGISVSMRYADYFLLEKPELGTFAATRAAAHGRLAGAGGAAEAPENRRDWQFTGASLRSSPGHPNV